MREARLEMMEGWSWRMLMPALLVGGNAAGITLFLIGLLVQGSNGLQVLTFVIHLFSH